MSLTDQIARVHDVGQQEADTRQDIVLIVGSHILELAEVVQGDDHVASRGVVS